MPWLAEVPVRELGEYCPDIDDNRAMGLACAAADVGDGVFEPSGMTICAREFLPVALLRIGSPEIE